MSAADCVLILITGTGSFFAVSVAISLLTETFRTLFPPKPKK